MERLCRLFVKLLFGCKALWVMGPCSKPVGHAVDGSLVPLGSTATHDWMIKEARRNSLGRNGDWSGNLITD